MSLPAAWIDKVFTKLSLAYGRDFLARWEGIDINDVKSDWGHELAGFARHPEAIAYALANLPTKAPSVIEFRSICRLAPAPEAPRLEAPKADPARVAAELAKLGAIVAAPKPAVQRLDWARAIVARAEGGAKVSPTCVRMAREALAKAGAA